MIDLWHKQTQEAHYGTLAQEEPQMASGSLVEHWNAVHCLLPEDSEHADQDIWTSVYLVPKRPSRTIFRRVAEPALSELRDRLANTDRHFRRKAVAVFRDKEAIRLLATLHQQSSVSTQEFVVGADGIPLAKLAAANFCNIGSSSIDITIDGRRFIERVAERVSHRPSEETNESDDPDIADAARMPISQALATEFHRLIAEWHEERGVTSSASQIVGCDSYRAIINLGQSVLPLIFGRMREEGDKPDHWFTALRELTGANPVQSNQRGNMRAMAKSWLRWAATNGSA